MNRDLYDLVTIVYRMLLEDDECLSERRRKRTLLRSLGCDDYDPPHRTTETQ